MNAVKIMKTNDELMKFKDELNKLPSKNAMIRYLKGQGMKVSEIVKFSRNFEPLQYDDGRELRPQHIYNVLKTPLIGK